MYFNPNCFSQEAFGTLGNFGREGLCRIPIARPSISFGRPNTGMEGEMQRKAYGNPKEVSPSWRMERQRLSDFQGSLFRPISPPTFLWEAFWDTRSAASRCFSSSIPSWRRRAVSTTTIAMI